MSCACFLIRSALIYVSVYLFLAHFVDSHTIGYDFVLESKVPQHL